MDQKITTTENIAQFVCENCNNEEPGTNLYLCSNGHKYCHACAVIIIYDMQRITCPIGKEDHRELYGTITDREKDDDDDFDDDNIDDFIDDDIHDYVDDI